jgi:hypothetical protein
MKTTSILSDRCGDVILRGHSIVRLEAGELATRHESPIDLCESCSDRFGDWLKTGRATAHTGQGALPGVSTMQTPLVGR